MPLPGQCLSFGEGNACGFVPDPEDEEWWFAEVIGGDEPGTPLDKLRRSLDMVPRAKKTKKPNTIRFSCGQRTSMDLKIKDYPGPKKLRTELNDIGTPVPVM